MKRYLTSDFSLSENHNDCKYVAHLTTTGTVARTYVFLKYIMIGICTHIVDHLFHSLRTEASNICRYLAAFPTVGRDLRELTHWRLANGWKREGKMYRKKKIHLQIVTEKGKSEYCIQTSPLSEYTQINT